MMGFSILTLSGSENTTQLAERRRASFRKSMEIGLEGL
jgi:hypothetical protein